MNTLYSILNLWFEEENVIDLFFDKPIETVDQAVASTVLLQPESVQRALTSRLSTAFVRHSVGFGA